MLPRKEFAYSIGFGGGCQNVRVVKFTLKDSFYRSDSDLILYYFIGCGVGIDKRVTW
jgi:hypothetical protein